MKRIKEGNKRRGQKKRIKKETAAKQSLVEVGGDGFEPPKLEAADLQSAPFGHSGNHPNRSNLCSRLTVQTICRKTAAKIRLFFDTSKF